MVSTFWDLNTTKPPTNPKADLADHKPTPVNASRERRVNQIKYRIDQSGPDKRSHYSAEQPFQVRWKHRQKDSVEQSDED